MVGLLDIGPLTKQVKVGDKELDVRGLTLGDLIELMQKHEAVKTLLESGTADLEKKLDAATLITTLPKAVWAIFAMCTGNSGNAEAETRASTLPLSIQLSILRGILDATFTEGIGPFVANINSLTANMKDVQEASETSPSLNGSQAPSVSALQVDLPQRRRSGLHRAS